MYYYVFGLAQQTRPKLTMDTIATQYSPSLRVVLWSAPRCMSSVFERSIRELQDVKVVYEPHQQAYYYGPERRKTDSNRPTPTELNPAATFQAADEKFLQPYEGYQAVFFKNHAYFVEGNYEYYTKGRFAHIKHTFLIRDPNKSIPSLVKACKMCGFSSFPGNNGIEQLYDLFKTVQHVDPNPIIIDADDLLMNPRNMMEHYCSATGLPFQEAMLTWTPGIVSDWTDFLYYQEWHGTAMMSSCFMKPTPTTTQQADALSQEIKDTVDKVFPFYEAMYAVRMKTELKI